MAGCGIIKKGNIFRLLGIPMGFGISNDQRWNWMLDKFRAKIFKWSDVQHSISHRSFILKHYILPSLTYFLSCWQPNKKQMGQAISLARKFLWSNSKIPKVAWNTCCMKKSEGGLGLICPSRMAIQMAAKWIYRSLSSNDFWACLIKRNIKRFYVKNNKSWSNCSLWDVITAPVEFFPKGSQLICNFWKAWMVVKTNYNLPVWFAHNSSFLEQDSLWFGWFNSGSLLTLPIRWNKCRKEGYEHWKDLLRAGISIDEQDIINSHGLSFQCKQILLNKKVFLVEKLGTNMWSKQIDIQDVAWDMFNSYKKSYRSIKEIKGKLNKKWGLQWSHLQWKYRFQCTWAFPLTNKQSCLSWLILHQGIWTGSHARKYKIDAGHCKLCGKVEDMELLFIKCKYALRFWVGIWSFCQSQGLNTPNCKDILIGEAKGMDILMWQIIRNHTFWHIWKNRNSAIYKDKRKDYFFTFMYGLRKIVRLFLAVPNNDQLDYRSPFVIMKNHHFNVWKTKLLRMYSKPREDLITFLGDFIDSYLL
ncbi:hypothetical protein KP509_15G010900 [Ceratopteris richardii]|uniref:Reverse transcriptase zinc-binding domain-containing protein n=1 Tax=Ceratopteris richardii TaxID=49495 RepID=A0A8T2T104_CERRI|nr:hypothetical protein KP509_15G010900 [Ceratopteris richardii]